jgi:hypothetical protein
MKMRGLRKYYNEKKQKENQYSSEKKPLYKSSRKIVKLDMQRTPSILERPSTKPNLIFNDQANKLKLKRDMLLNEDKENQCLNKNENENTYESKESKDTQDNTIRKHASNYNFRYSKNNILKRRQSRFSKLQLRLSAPLNIENNYHSNIEIDKDKDIKKEKCYKLNYYNTAYNLDCEIEDLINSTTSKIEKEKEEKNKENKENNEFKKYLEQVRKTKLSKNNLTNGTLAIIQMQISNAKESIINDKYITYINNEYHDEDKNNICFRLGRNNMCVCGHAFWRHNLVIKKNEFSCKCRKCECPKFNYIPVFPEETNEYSKSYLLDFKYDEWKAGCKCGHNWTHHNFNDGEKCGECNCKKFQSNFSCGVCGNSWENHVTLFEKKEDREKSGKIVGKDYEPFTNEQLQNLFNK